MGIVFCDGVQLSSQLDSTAPLIRFSAPFEFLWEQRGIDWRIYLVFLFRLQMWISKDTRSFFRFGGM